MDLDGEILRKALVALLHLSQEEAAERLNVGRSTVQRWERGEHSPQPMHQRKIDEVYGDALRTLGVLLEHAASSEQPERDSEQEGASAQSASLQSTEGTEAQDHDAPVVLVVTNASSASAPVVPDELHVFIVSHLTTHLWNLAHLPHPTCDDKRRHIREAIKEFDSMNSTNKNYHLTRREALCSLAVLPMITLGLTTSGSTLQPAQYGTALAHCAASIEACWTLYKSGDASDLALAFQSVSTYLPTLETIAHNSSRQRQEALDLATRCALLKTFLGWDCAGPTEVIQYAKQAVAFSKQTDDISLQLSAYSKLAWAYFYNKQYMLALTTAQEAEASLLGYTHLASTQPLPPSIQGGTYSTLALMQARNGRSPDMAIGKATEIDPGNESYAFMDFKRSNLLLETGLTYCYQGDQVKAMKALEQRVDVQTLTPKIPQSAQGRVDTITIMALSSLKAKDRDMDKAIHFLTVSITGAITLQSEQLFSDVQTTHEFMEIAWPGEPRIRELRELIVHW